MTIWCRGRRLTEISKPNKALLRSRSALDKKRKRCKNHCRTSFRSHAAHRKDVRPRTPLRALNTLGRRFRTALTALVVCALLAAGVTTSEVMAAGEDAQLEQLWDEFPLDERDEPPVRNQPFDRQSPPSKPAPARPTADQASDGSTRLGFLTFGIALLLGASGILLLLAGPLGPPSGTSEADSYRNRLRRRLADARTTGWGENRAVHALLDFLAEDEFVAEDASAAQQSKELKVPGDLKKPDQRTDAMALKERRPQMRVSKPAPSVDEREVLKRKSAADAERLKAKGAREAALLKEKLVSRQRRQQSVKGGEPAPNVAEQPIRPRRRGDLSKAGSLRPRPDCRHVGTAGRCSVSGCGQGGAGV